jgi:hypothetical protein
MQAAAAVAAVAAVPALAACDHGWTQLCLSHCERLELVSGTDEMINILCCMSDSNPIAESVVMVYL